MNRRITEGKLDPSFSLFTPSGFGYLSIGRDGFSGSENWGGGGGPISEEGTGSK